MLPELEKFRIGRLENLWEIREIPLSANWLKDVFKKKNLHFLVFAKKLVRVDLWFELHSDIIIKLLIVIRIT